MKFIKILIIVFVFIGCSDDFLNLTPNSSIEEADFYKNDAEVLAGIIGMYDAIQGTNFLSDNFDNETKSAGIQYEYYLTEMRSDNTKMRDPEGEEGEFDSWQITSTNTIVANYYKSFYEIIFRANKVLDFVKNADEDNQIAYTAEARFVRAYAYFNLVRLFGDIPLLDTLDDIGTDAEFIRVSVSDIYTFIKSDLVTAISNLDNTYKSRASQAAAKTLLAKVNLTEGNYSEAQILCSEIIESNEFELLPNFKDVFYNESNNEVIFSVGYLSDIEEESQGFSAEWSRNTSTRGTNMLTDNFITTFSSDQGEARKLFSYRNLTGPTRSEVAKYIASGDDNLDISSSAINVQNAGNDWIILRYADVYLMYVEALMGVADELNLTATDSDTVKAKFYYEEIRRRAGIVDYEVNLITKADLLNERRIELAFENKRFFDLVRFGVAQDVLQQFSVESENGGVFTEFDLLLPIPEREITLSGGIMKQNPGY